MVFEFEILNAFLGQDMFNDWLSLFAFIAKHCEAFEGGGGSFEGRLSRFPSIVVVSQE